jgi:molecular chaperone GrpE
VSAPAPSEGQTSSDELEERLRWALADLDNLRKRFAREVSRERDVERTNAASAWLPVLDNLELALRHADSGAGGGGGERDPLVAGVQAVRDQALSVLERLGFSRFDDVGEQFDPQRHEAASAVATSDEEPGTIVAVIRPGYRSGDALLRPASVVVAREPDSG